MTGLSGPRMTLPSFLQVQKDGVRLAIKVLPRASRTEIGAPLGNELKIKVAAPPVDSAANDALVRFLAEKLDCPRGSIQLVRGHTSRHKIVEISGLSPGDVLARLLAK
jgi:uncharacterized protein (TIGR00251 family)